MMRATPDLRLSQTDSTAAVIEANSQPVELTELDNLARKPVVKKESRARKPVVKRDQDAVTLYKKWKETKEPPVVFTPGKPSSGPWSSKAAQAFVLAVELRRPGFERYALSQFVQNCGLMAFGPWSYIEKSTDAHSAIRLFANHWVAWNLKISGGEAKEFEGLAAAGLVGQVPKEGGRDPRIYDLEHWYDLCGHRFLPGCDHDPISRAERVREANRPPKAELPEVGRDEEEKRQREVAAGLSSPRSSSTHSNHRVSVTPPPPAYSTPPILAIQPPPPLPPPRVPTPAPSHNSGGNNSSRSSSALRRTIATFLFLLVLTTNLGTAVFLLRNYYYECGVRSTSIKYTMFTVAAGFLCGCLPRVERPKKYFVLYTIVAIGDGIALAIDTKRSENEAYYCQPNQTYTIMCVLTAGTWLSVPWAWFYLKSWR